MAAPEAFDAAPISPVNTEPEQEVIVPVQALGNLATLDQKPEVEHHTKVHDPHQMTRFRAKAHSR